MMPDNYIRLMYVRFDDGEVMYHRPHYFRVLDLLKVTDYYSVYVPNDGYEARQAGVEL
jgi:hypothetical protein